MIKKSAFLREDNLNEQLTSVKRYLKDTDIHKIDKGDTLLQYAAENGNYEAIENLCSQYYTRDIFKLLIKKESEQLPFNEGVRDFGLALMRAARHGHIKIVTYLLKQGMPLQMVMVEGKTPSNNSVNRYRETMSISYKIYSPLHCLSEESSRNHDSVALIIKALEEKLLSLPMQCLDLSSLKCLSIIEPSYLNDLFEVIPRNTHLTKLNLSSIKINENLMTSISHCIAFTSSINYLNLSGNELKGNYFRILMEAVKLNNTLKALDLKDTNIGELETDILLNVLREKLQVHYLDLRANYIYGRKLIALAQLMRECQWITEIKISNEKIPLLQGPTDMLRALSKARKNRIIKPRVRLLVAARILLLNAYRNCPENIFFPVEIRQLILTFLGQLYNLNNEEIKRIIEYAGYYEESQKPSKEEFCKSIADFCANEEIAPDKISPVQVSDIKVEAVNFNNFRRPLIIGAVCSFVVIVLLKVLLGISINMSLTNEVTLTIVTIAFFAPLIISSAPFFKQAIARRNYNHLQGMLVQLEANASNRNENILDEIMIEDACLEETPTSLLLGANASNRESLPSIDSYSNEIEAETGCVEKSAPNCIIL